MNDIWHRGKQLENGNVLIQPTAKEASQKEISYPKTVEDINNIYVAIAYIIKYPHNLQRVSGYKCDHHNKYHRYTFYSCISFTFPYMRGVDTEKEVIEFAKELFIDYLKKESK